VTQDRYGSRAGSGPRKEADEAMVTNSQASNLLEVLTNCSQN